MSLDITIELGDEDLDHFIEAMRRAQAKAADMAPEAIASAASKLLTDVPKVKVPAFIRDRLEKLDTMIQLVKDEGYGLPEEDRQRVLSCLAYFADPQDIIPDSVPVIGFLDDAIMIELCVRELKHELDAYDDFCEFREREAKKRGIEPAKVGRTDWLDGRRDELVDRMHARRSRDGGEFGIGYGSSSGYGKPTYSRAWRPSLFRFR